MIAVHVPTEDIFNMVCTTEYSIGKVWGSPIFFSTISENYGNNGVIYINGYSSLMYCSLDYVKENKHTLLSLEDYYKLRNIYIEIDIKIKNKITSNLYKAIYNNSIIYCVVPSDTDLSDKKYKGYLIKNKFYIFT